MRKGILYSVIASEGIHIFCCVLPTLFSILSLLAGMGLIAAMPGFIDELHHAIHDYEITMIITSAAVLVIGWALYGFAQRLNCSEEAPTCCHEPCAPQKDRTKAVMIIATLLFAINVTVYFSLHRDVVDIPLMPEYAHEHDHTHDHHNH